MSGHARNAPSDAKRWLRCPGALNLCRKLGLENTAGIAAAEGTAAHWVSEMCFGMGFEPTDFLGAKIQADSFTFIVDDEMCEALQPGLDRIAEFPGKRFSERRVDTTPWVGMDEDGNPQRGTLDRAVVGSDEIVIGDLKFGRGIPVQCVGNEQIRIYALAFWQEIAQHLTDATSFRFIIDQPRNAQGGGEWVQTLDELLAFGEHVRERALLTFDEDAPCIPSKDACLWCPAAKIDGACVSYEKWNLEFCDIDFEDLDSSDDIAMPEIDGLTVSRKKTLYEHLGVIRKFLDRVESTVRGDVFIGDGEKYSMKVVDGRRSRRKHIDEEKSEAWLVKSGRSAEDIFNKKLITPAQVDKLIGKGKFPKSLIIGGEPQPAIVPIADDRPEIIIEGQTFEDFTTFEDLDD
jgi:Protein of unknown function (DUF2800)